jgi:hypothetical protein
MKGCGSPWCRRPGAVLVRREGREGIAYADDSDVESFRSGHGFGCLEFDV